MSVTSYEAFLAQSKRGNVIAVVQELFSGSETPLSVFEKTAAGRPGSFLLESAEHGVWARYSFVGVNVRGFLAQRSGEPVTWHSPSGAAPLPNGVALNTSTALGALRQLQSAWVSDHALAELPPLANGLVGVIGWDVIRELENLPSRPGADFDAPTLGMSLFEDLVVLDHKTNKLLLIANVFIDAGFDAEASYAAAMERLENMRESIARPTEAYLAELNLNTPLTFEPRMTAAEFMAKVEQSKEYVRKGDVFQVVLSQRFDMQVSASPLDVYRVLRTLNPSPYMYLLNFTDADGDYAIVGASPESLVQVQGGAVTTHPIAGSRPRGSDIDQDAELADQLVADAKERAEHLMLVDLARNDLLRVCAPDSVAVTEFMQVHRYSHIMHLVSSVSGRLRADKNAVDAFAATFPAGTLSGAPKPRALEIIDELEPANRGTYGGVVGYFDFAGNADLAIAIRTAFLRNGMARVQAGAGIVLDSDPAAEHAETISKASAPMRAIAAANSLRRIEAALGD
ncbi:MAG: hypothetical protein RL645_927 [Actinomycetota bacterium]